MNQRHYLLACLILPFIVGYLTIDIERDVMGDEGVVYEFILGLYRWSLIPYLFFVGAVIRLSLKYNDEKFHQVYWSLPLLFSPFCELVILFFFVAMSVNSGDSPATILMSAFSALLFTPVVIIFAAFVGYIYISLAKLSAWILLKLGVLH